MSARERELTPEELDQQEAAELPAREAMTLINTGHPIPGLISQSEDLPYTYPEEPMPLDSAIDLPPSP